MAESSRARSSNTQQNILKLPKQRTPFTDHVKSSVDAFLLYFDEKMIQAIVDYTNIEGAREKGSKWRATDTIEMKSFIGCLLHTGALRQNDISVEVLFSPVDGNPLVRAAFSMNRFSNLLNHLRFDDKTTRSARRERDAFCPIRDLWYTFHSKISKYFVLGESITVDEQLVPFRGRCKFIQYMPSKPDKYGIKIFWACDAKTNYPLRASPYLGKDATGARPADRNVGIAAGIVQTLTKDFQGTGRNVTCDNYFTNLSLAENLAKQKLTMVGTVNRNKTFLPLRFPTEKSPSFGGIRVPRQTRDSVGHISKPENKECDTPQHNAQ